ncbi:sulfite exporter TauE/SafE family protein [Lusitaniella coriacea LEGE 07157]|uniref:Probable membrane transporter protein n=1 Tax=Lusitaniella coriacea LEGE 07157 TaxID=945747 RepID=A0A8J7E1V2_9CYAN|nr:sulfite exporter TauE/SafE family protein [Lusitaniella coriacea]MBE9118788.1 sulfite exporter TauE/SafE family protein [Lusitaniella coriacea LEGE 07157]
MIPENGLILAVGGLISGLLAGLLGIGGGVVLVPILVSLNYEPVQATATSSLAIILTSLSGTLQNWHMGYLNVNRVLLLAFPSLITAQIGAYWGDILPQYLLLAAFGLLLLVNIFLVMLRKRLIKQKRDSNRPKINSLIARLGTGGTAGLLAGLFGVGGGVIMVPLQMLLLAEPIKVAIQTSLGAIVIISISACLGHAYRGNVFFLPGILLGLGGIIGAQISTRYLPKLPDKVVDLSFRTMLIILAIYFFFKAWINYQG